MKKEFYVYVYLDPLKPGKFVYNNYEFSFEPFYVGKGKGKRYYYHIYNCNLKNNTFKAKKLKKIFQVIDKTKFKKEYICFVLKEVDEKKAIKKEIDLIKQIGRRIEKNGPLVNITQGGEGWGIPWNKGLKCPQIGRKGKIPWNKNQTNVYDKDTRKKMSQSKKGKKLSKKHCQNIGLASKKRLTLQFSSDVNKEIIRLYILGYKQQDLIFEFNKLTGLNIKTRGVIQRILKEANIQTRTTAQTKLFRKQ